MAANYQSWIAAHQPTDPRGQCVEMTRQMASEFPELRRVRGHYTCPLDGQRHSHWWLVARDGSVIDPTAEQFASNGRGDYEEYTGPEPTGQCLDCGELLFNGDYFCNAECAMNTAKFMAGGGDIFVNGQRVSPHPGDVLKGLE